MLLESILAIGRMLDRRQNSGGPAGSGHFGWASRSAPAAQGGYASAFVASRDLSSPKAGDVVAGGRYTSEGAGAADREILEPRIVSHSRGMVVVMKPVHWEVDGRTSEGGAARLLSSFLQSALPRASCPVVHSSELDFGFVHRLDVPSSGLVLAGTSLEGLFHLKWQIAVYSLDRHYVTANHGHLSSEARGVSEKVEAPSFENTRSLTDGNGKPARTHLSLLGHFCFRSEDRGADAVGGGMEGSEQDGRSSSRGNFDVSFVAISIHTGRRHQIRAHTRHLGHPTASDPKYAPRDVFLSLPRGSMLWIARTQHASSLCSA
mmetsp:Transcript_163775/g.525212  ORF Transcript_163775/g.525212 Transcript_163775/m.525212 type:complete len:319 (+) Transcript_163775:1687-2643(+)